MVSYVVRLGATGVEVVGGWCVIEGVLLFGLLRLEGGAAGEQRAPETVREGGI